MTVIKPIVRGSLDYSTEATGIALDLSVLDVPGQRAVLINEVIGTGYDDHIIGNSSPGQELIGGDGDDVLVGRGLKTVYNGGEGEDTADFSELDNVTVNLGENTSNRGENFISIENLVGGQGHNSLVGNALTNTLVGGDIEDILNGGGGADLLIGGGGDDIYFVDNVRDVVIEEAEGGIDKISANVSFTLAANVENLSLEGGSPLNGVGNALSNLITGNDARNALSGGGGNDVLRGNGGNDSLSGGDGDDVLWGGLGADIMRAGSGRDQFAFSSAAESTVANPDQINWFNQGDDRINLKAIDADLDSSGNQSFRYIGDDVFSGRAGELRFEDHKSYVLVLGDLNGDATADFAIRLNDFHAALFSSDFVL